MKYKLLSIILGILLFTATLLSAVLITAYDTRNYDNGNVLKFLRGGELDEKVFSQREILHMQDVRSLLRWCAYALYASLILLAAVFFLIIRKGKKALYQTLAGGSIVAVGLTAITALASLNFDWLFLKFHKIFFSNSLWQLPPGAELLNLFPKEFFRNAAAKILAVTFLVQGAILINALLFRKRVRRCLSMK